MTDSTNSSIKMPIRRMNVDELDNNTTAILNTQRTNCITEIPQDIKLELLNGELKVLAGSKVYVPNGAEKFDEVVIENDIAASIPYTNEPIFVYYYNNGLVQANSTAQCSGASNTITNGFWYDTTNNIIKRVNNSVPSYSGISFPIAIVSASNDSWTSIDQIFNGFGYIGSTIFTLPGVKGLIPTGRNKDGGLKNIELVSDRVWTRTWESNPYYKDLSIATTGIGINTNTYKEEENFVYNAAGNKVTDRFVFGKMEYSASSPYNVTTFTTKTTFHTVDYYDYIASKSVVATGTTEIRTLSDRFADVINVKDFGAKGDGVTDDTAAVQAAFVYAHRVGGGKVIFPKSTYLIANTSNYISIGANLVIDFCGSTILREKERHAGFSNNIDTTIGSYEGGNIIMENGTIDCGAYENETLSNVGCLSFGYAKNITVRNMVFKNFQGYGHFIEVSGCDNVGILNCKFLGYKRGTDSGIRECIQLEATTELNYWWGTFTNDKTKNIVIDGCYFGKDPDNTNVNYTAPDCGIGGHGTNNGISVDNVTVVNCVFDGLRYAGVHAWCWKNALINNNLFIDCYNSVVLSVQEGTNNYDTEGNLIGYAFCGSDIMISNNVVKINTPNNVRRIFDSNEDLSNDSEQKRIKNVSIVNNIITSDTTATDDETRAAIYINNMENILIKGNNISYHVQYCIQGNRNNYDVIVDGNKIENVYNYAINFSNPTNEVTIKNNDINVNLGSSGIRAPIMINGVSNTKIKDNLCNVTSGGTVYGIRLYGESDNIAILNNVSYGGSISYTTATNGLQKGNNTFIDSWTSE